MADPVRSDDLGGVGVPGSFLPERFAKFAPPTDKQCGLCPSRALLRVSYNARTDDLCQRCFDDLVNLRSPLIKRVQQIEQTARGTRLSEDQFNAVVRGDPVFVGQMRRRVTLADGPFVVAAEPPTTIPDQPEIEAAQPPPAYPVYNLSKFMEERWAQVGTPITGDAWVTPAGFVYAARSGHRQSAVEAFQGSGLWPGGTLEAVQDASRRDAVAEMIAAGFVAVHSTASEFNFELESFDRLTFPQRERLASEVLLAIDLDKVIEAETAAPFEREGYLSHQTSILSALMRRHYGPGSHPDAGTSQDVHAGKDRGADDESPWPMDDILRAEAAIVQNHYETGVFFTPDGEVARAQGDSEGVDFDFVLERTIIDLNDDGVPVLLTHNHPSFGGGPLSVTDISFAVAFGIEEIVAVGDQVRYRMIFKPEMQLSVWEGNQDPGMGPITGGMYHRAIHLIEQNLRRHASELEPNATNDVRARAMSFTLSDTWHQIAFEYPEYVEYIEEQR